MIYKAIEYVLPITIKRNIKSGFDEYRVYRQAALSMHKNNPYHVEFRIRTFIKQTQQETDF